MTYSNSSAHRKNFRPPSEELSFIGKDQNHSKAGLGGYTCSERNKSKVSYILHFKVIIGGVRVN